MCAHVARESDRICLQAIETILTEIPHSRLRADNCDFCTKNLEKLLV